MYARVALALVVIAIFATNISSSGTPAKAGAPQTPSNFKVAFIGDQNINTAAEDVLNLIAAEGAEMVIHLGDLGYGNEFDPQRAIDWDAQITSILGAAFPYFGLAGNHDVGNWSTYQQLLEDRLALISGAVCVGDYGVMAACTYQGLFFILSGAGTLPNVPDDQPQIDFIQNQLASDSSTWRICAWHKNQNAMQLGTKTDEVGWGPYEACRLGRAIIATGHEHSYSRTKTLTSIENQTIDPASTDPTIVRVVEGSTFVFVSGLAGRSVRDQNRCLPITPPYGCNSEWASIYTSDQSANFGALFIEFHVDGDPNKASAYFKDINGNVIDTFTIFSQTSVGGIAELPDAATPPTLTVASQSRSPTEAAIVVATLIAASALITAVWRAKRAGPA